MSELYIKTLTGKTITLTVDPNTTTIREMKEQIEKKEGTPVENQRLICAGVVLEDEWLVSNYSRLQRSTIHLIVRLENSGKNIKPAARE